MLGGGAGLGSGARAGTGRKRGRDHGHGGDRQRGGRNEPRHQGRSAPRGGNIKVLLRAYRPSSLPRESERILNVFGAGAKRAARAMHRPVSAP
ncbi:MAG: hypothetical protein AcusKO_03710 [Acuticoccus sp.]